MLGVQVDLLTGRYVACRFNNRSRVEWPPHPARLFSAAVAAWADADDPDPEERESLLWWEAQSPPSITCSWGAGQWSEREPVTHFVPVNDTSALARDVGLSYRRLIEAIETAGQVGVSEPGTANDRAVTKADRAVAKLRAKVVVDSAKASAGGSAPRSALGVLPDHRVRQARQYPTALPASDLVTYQWPEADGRSSYVAALERLLPRIARLGHSSSLVSVTVTETALQPSLVPDERGSVVLRVASCGQLDELEAAFSRHRGEEPRILPALIATYGVPGPVHAVPAPMFAQVWQLLDLSEGPRMTIRDVLPLARAVRGALMRHGEQDPVPEVISGHAAGPPGSLTAPTGRPHLAIVPLPFTGHQHADGLVRSVALVLPSEIDDRDRALVDAALRRWFDSGGALRLGSRGVVKVLPVEQEDAPHTARPGWWCRDARRWVSVTPIALDRNPGNLRDRDPVRRAAAERAAEDIIASSCINIGLPAPAAVALTMDPLTTGSAPVRSFPRYAVQRGRLQRVLVHAEVVFAEPVAGPLLLGAGRFLGYGLCTPLLSPVEEGHRDA